MSLSIFEKEERLFKEWIEHEEWIKNVDWTGLSEVSLDDVFCPDGLHFTGEPYEYSQGGKVYCEMDSGNQEDLWARAALKPVFLCKDYNGKEKDEDGNERLGKMDIRAESGGSEDVLYYRFYSRYMILLYGLSNYKPETNSFPSFEEARIKENYWKGDNGFFHAPVVRINLKKVSGWSTCNDWVLTQYIEKDKEFINRQKDIYAGANVFVCCHAGEPTNPIIDLLKEWFPDLKPYKPSSRFLWYSQASNVIVLHEYHMSNRVSYREYYNAIPELEEFLGENPHYLDYNR